MNINGSVKAYNRYRTVLKYAKRLLPEAITTSNKPLVRPAKYMSLYHLKRIFTPTPKPQQATPEQQAELAKWWVEVEEYLKNTQTLNETIDEGHKE